MNCAVEMMYYDLQNMNSKWIKYCAIKNSEIPGNVYLILTTSFPPSDKKVHNWNIIFLLQYSSTYMVINDITLNFLNVFAWLIENHLPY